MEDMFVSLNKELFKEELFKSPFLDLILKQLNPGDEIIAILLAGSQTNSLATDTSDIDLSIKTFKT
jgi:DNA polymerase sigma